MFRFDELSIQIFVIVAFDRVDGPEGLNLSCCLNVVVLVSAVLAVERDYDNFSEVRNNSEKHSSFSLKIRSKDYLAIIHWIRGSEIGSPARDIPCKAIQ